MLFSLVVVAQPGTGEEPALTVLGNSDQQTLATWAAGRFREAGLTLPDLNVYFRAERTQCTDHPGVFRAPGTIDLCLGDNPITGLHARLTVLHEIAHAWAHHNLSDEHKERFLHLRGLPSWNDPATPWECRGSEHAAEIIAWALLDQPIGMVRLPDNHPDQLTDAYRVLTGELPQHRLREDQAAPDRSVPAHKVCNTNGPATAVTCPTPCPFDVERVDDVVAEVRRVARSVEGSEPDASVSIEFVEVLPDPRRFVQGMAYIEAGRVLVRLDAHDWQATVVHEVAHVLAHDRDHGETWCSLYVAAMSEVLGVTRGVPLLTRDRVPKDPRVVRA